MNIKLLEHLRKQKKILANIQTKLSFFHDKTRDMISIFSGKVTSNCIHHLKTKTAESTTVKDIANALTYAFSAILSST